MCPISYRKLFIHGCVLYDIIQLVCIYIIYAYVREEKIEMTILLTNGLSSITEKMTREEGIRLSHGDWSIISEYKKLSEDFIAKFSDLVDWTKVSEYQTLSESFIERFADRVNWREISVHQQLSDAFTTKFYDKLDINRVIENSCNISEDFIRDNIDNMTEYSWMTISYSRNLSEEFIREFQDKLDWDNIFDNQDLSEEFRKEFSYKLEEIEKKRQSYEDSNDYFWDPYYNN